MRGFVKYLMMLLVSMLSVSCIFDSDPCVMPADETRNIIFTISFADNKSRATWEQDYTKEEGVPFDLRIDPEKLNVVIFAQNGTRLGTLEYLLYFPTDNDDTKFQFIGQMPEAFAKHYKANTADDKMYKFMVLANCDASSNGEEYITYSHTQLNPFEEDAVIPMWGVKEVELTPLIDNQIWDIEEIWLLRAAAKIEVKLDQALKDKGTTITEATLKYYNQTGYVLPNGGMDAKLTKDLDQEECVRVYRHAAVNLPFIKDEKTGDYYVYVTEYDNKNINYSDERNKISLKCKMGEEEKTFEDAISFRDYSDGLPTGDYYNIVRNHIYEFKILSIAGSNLLLEYTVADWTKEDWNGNGKEYEEHDLSYPTYHNPVVPYEFLNLTAEQQANFTFDEPTMYFSGGSAGNLENGGFHCYFQILAPENVQWKPIFMGTKENYRIRVYDHAKALIYDTAESGDLSDDLSVCGSNEWFHIVIFPLSAAGANNETIDFGISYYQAWTDQYINLYVNGEYDNIRWPNSGNNPKLISVSHVSEPQSNS